MIETPTDRQRFRVSRVIFLDSWQGPVNDLLGTAALSSDVDFETCLLKTPTTTRSSTRPREHWDRLQATSRFVTVISRHPRDHYDYSPRGRGVAHDACLASFDRQRNYFCTTSL